MSAAYERLVRVSKAKPGHLWRHLRLGDVVGGCARRDRRHLCWLT